MFEAFGVSAQAETAYRTLVRNPATRMEDLAVALAVDLPRIRTLLTELTGFGLLVPDLAGGSRVTVVPPERALETLIDREEAELERRRQALGGLREDISGLVAEYVDSRRARIGDLVEALHGPDAVRSRLYQLSRASSTAVWTLNPGPAPPPGALADSSRLIDAQTRARGVQSRSVFSVAAAADAACAAYLAEAVKAGEEIRVHPDPPMRLLLVDHETAIIPLDPEDHPAGAYVLHGAALVAPLTALFELVWAASSRFRSDGPPAVDPDEARLRQVVALLAEGHKDEAIARRVGVSVRTVRRLIATAINRLDAESRFQAGALAVRRGWVPATEPTTDD
jgi:DNA-binding CsgD family transcriptional regulator